MSSDVIISVKNLSKRYEIYDRPLDRLKEFFLPALRNRLGLNSVHYYKEFWALQDITFEVARGQTIGILGRNGAGKSTLLQLICGTLTPTSGSVQVNGRIAALLELGIGFNREFTGRENVYLKASLLGLTRKEIDARFAEIVEFAGLEDFIDQPVKTYSSGMNVRLAFSVIAHVDADILIIDEALSVGDAFFVQKCMRFLRNFMQHGTVVFVSHDSGAVINLCDYAYLIEGGILNKAGKPKAVVEHYLQKLALSSIDESQVNRKKELKQTDTKERESKNNFISDYKNLINTSTLRNDIQVFKFNDKSADFGMGGVVIKNVSLLNSEGEQVSHIIGGELVSLLINGVVLQEISNGIAGFMLKDRLGQSLFGDNTFLRLREKNNQFSSGDNFQAKFTFMMPILPIGDYSFNVAFADGTQDNHIQHHWIHDALIIRSRSTSISTGLIGVEMLEIDLCNF